MSLNLKFLVLLIFGISISSIVTEVYLPSFEKIDIHLATIIQKINSDSNITWRVLY